MSEEMLKNIFSQYFTDGRKGYRLCNKGEKGFPSRMFTIDGSLVWANPFIVVKDDKNLVNLVNSLEMVPEVPISTIFDNLNKKFGGAVVNSYGLEVKKGKFNLTSFKTIDEYHGIYDYSKRKLKTKINDGDSHGNDLKLLNYNVNYKGKEMRVLRYKWNTYGSGRENNYHITYPEYFDYLASVAGVDNMKFGLLSGIYFFKDGKVKAHLADIGRSCIRPREMKEIKEGKSKIYA